MTTDDTGSILSPEQMYEWLQEGMELTLEADDQVYRSHEALRARLTAAEERAEQAERERDRYYLLAIGYGQRAKAAEAQVAALRAENTRLTEALRAARFVALHWRDAALNLPFDSQVRIMAHPLNLVIDAIDGERDPVQLGIDTEAHADFDAALAAAPPSPEFVDITQQVDDLLDAPEGVAEPEPYCAEYPIGGNDHFPSPPVPSVCPTCGFKNPGMVLCTNRWHSDAKPGETWVPVFVRREGTPPTEPERIVEGADGTVVAVLSTEAEAQAYADRLNENPSPIGQYRVRPPAAPPVERCPTCGSDDRAVTVAECDGAVMAGEQPDPWHSDLGAEER